MLRKQINGATLRGTDSIDRTLNAVTLSEDEKKKVGELYFLPNDVLLADGVKAVAANDKVGLTEEEISKGLKKGKWLSIRAGKDSEGNFISSIVEGAAYSSDTGMYSHAEGYESKAHGHASHAEGYTSYAGGNWSHAEGCNTNSDGDSSHSEGRETHASGFIAHAEGFQTNANGDMSHSEGSSCSASGSQSHAEGYSTNADGENSHAEGDNTITTTVAEHAEGKYNYSKLDMFISTIGVGSVNDRKNGMAVGVTGELFLIGVGRYEGKSNANANSVLTLLRLYEYRISALETKIEQLENTNKSE